MKGKSDCEMVKILVLVLIALTFFSAAPFDHEWIFIWQVEYSVISNFIQQHPTYRIIWLVSVVAQVGIIRSYFLIGKSHFGLYIILSTLVYLICKIFLFTLFSIALLPFLMLWIWILFASYNILGFHAKPNSL
jgi:hypothetical protein